MALVSELEKIRQEVADNRVKGVELCEGLSEAQLAWRPRPRKWSIAEILVHLRITADTFLPPVDTAIEQARRKKLYAEGPFRPRWIDRLFVWYVEPPPVVRLPSPRMLRPVLDGPASAALGEWIESQQRMLARVEAANGLDLLRAGVTSPMARFVRMSLLAFFGVYTGHERRHLWQAANVHRALQAAMPV